MNALSGLYGRVTQLRRAWYEKRPARQRRLERPVISVGNLTSGGSGKTPLVAMLARLLREHGERPAILSRGYGRKQPVDGVLVVSDGRQMLEPVERSGDEPQMLGRALPDVPVLVSPDRHLAGRMAERHFACTVHLLDDGFQHVQLARDVDVLLVAAVDLDDRVLPAGRLREPLTAARVADALVVPGSDADVAAVAARLGHDSVFRAVSQPGPLRSLARDQPLPAVHRVLAVAGIARPVRFFDALRAQGLEVVREMVFRDHHWFTARELTQIEQAARELQADAIVTTEKDAVRLAPHVAWSVLPIHLSIDPIERFTTWLLDRLQAARAA